MIPTDLDLMRRSAGEACAVLRVLVNEDRLLLLCLLSQQEMCVSDLEEALHIYQPTLSQQLGVLRTQGLVNTRREGKKIFYSLADTRVLQVIQTLHALYCADTQATDR